MHVLPQNIFLGVSTLGSCFSGVWLEFRWKIDYRMGVRGVKVSFLQKCYDINDVHCAFGLNEAEIIHRLWRKAQLNMNRWLLPRFREILTTADQEPNHRSSRILHIDLFFRASRFAVCNGAISYITITKWPTGGYLEACVFVVTVSVNAIPKTSRKEKSNHTRIFFSECFSFHS